MLDRAGISNLLADWLAAWNQHDLTGVLEPMADEVIFEHWNGRVIRGKHQLGRAWQPWFSSHGNFHFEMTNCCLDEARQSFSFEWRLAWPSPEPRVQGQLELRTGVDVVQLRDGKITSKRTYIKTCLMIDNRPLLLTLQP